MSIKGDRVVSGVPERLLCWHRYPRCDPELQFGEMLLLGDWVRGAGVSGLFPITACESTITLNKNFLKKGQVSLGSSAYLAPLREPS